MSPERPSNAAPVPVGCFGWGMIAVLIAIAVLILPGLIGLKEKRAEVVQGRARLEITNFVAALRHFEQEYRHLPDGSPAEVLRQLEGVNPRSIVFLERSSTELKSAKLNEAGELLDPWGMPYRVSGVEGGVPRVYSTGPNKKDEGGAEKTDDVVSWR